MECNKDEALRAKSIAEGKFEKKDYDGAKRFASKAQNLYPGLDGISQMLTTVEVYISAENKISGEINWYSVFNANPTDNDETLRKQYLKLALMLHPDKNKSVGADGAFKIVSQAWALLSDKAKKLAYDQKRGFKEFQQRSSTPSAVPSAPAKANGTPSVVPSASPRANGAQGAVPSTPAKANGAPQASPSAPAKGKGVQSAGPSEPAKKNGSPSASPSASLKVNGAPNTLRCPHCKKSFIAANNGVPRAGPSAPGKAKGFHNSTASVPNTQSAKVHPPTQKPTAPMKKNNTFLPDCHRCKMYYEFLKMYLSSTLICPNCKEASANQVYRQKQQGPSNHLCSRNPGRNIPAAKKSGPVQPPGSNSVKSPTHQNVPLSGSKPSVSRTDHSVGAKTSNVKVGSRMEHSRYYG